MNSYVALRICPGASAEVWWEAVRLRSDAPAAVAALMRGRSRVEVTAEEAAFVLDWAGAIAGWATAEPKPLFMHEPAGAATG